MRRVAIFAHYDPRDTIKRYIVHHLAALREVCDEVHFASTAQLADKELAKLEGIVTSHRLCENTGYDFGMWARVIGGLALGQWDELVLTNSSVFGPLVPLAGAFERMRGVDCDFWGMTDSLEMEYHIQSFFLVFRARLLKSGQVERFFASVLPYRNKWQVIRSYEIGLTHFLLDQGFKPSVVASVGDPRLRIGVCNPCIGMPIALTKLGVPYVKVELLRDNPYHLRLAPVRARMAALGYPIDCVELERLPKRKILSWFVLRCHRMLRRLRQHFRPAAYLIPAVSAAFRAAPTGSEHGKTSSAIPAPTGPGGPIENPLDRARRPGGSTP
jgi:rhamnosyltransferase